jgi:hypothetical protein
MLSLYIGKRINTSLPMLQKEIIRTSSDFKTLSNHHHSQTNIPQTSISEQSTHTQPPTHITQIIKMVASIQISTLRAPYSVPSSARTSTSSTASRPTAERANSGSKFSLKSVGKKVTKGLKEHHERTEAAFDAVYGPRILSSRIGKQ